jgi:ankyrin repeat protein
VFRYLALALVLADTPASSRLVDAVARRDSMAIRTLLGRGVDVNAPDVDGATALQWAAHWDDVDTALALIDAGAAVDASNDLGVTPLMLAVTNRSHLIAQRLLAKGANPNARTKAGETVLMAAARAGALSVVKALIAGGATIDAREPNLGQTALMWAAAERHSDVVGELLARGAGVNLRSNAGFTALMFAAQQGDVASTHVLAAAGADINHAAPDGSTPLLIASASSDAITASNYQIVATPSDHEAVALALLDRKATVAAADSFGRTALHFAVETNKRRLAEQLIARGADPNARMRRGLPYRRGDYVTRAGYGGATPFWFAARAVNVPLMRILALAGADVNIGTVDNMSPLMIAVGMGEADSRLPPEPRALESVAFAVDAGALVNAVHARSGQSALHVAAAFGRTSIIEYLFEHGANLDLPDRQGRTALAIAEDSGRPRPEAASLLRALAPPR